MYETIKRLYLARKITENGLENAVKKGWITQAQADGLSAATAETEAPAELEGTSDG